MKLAHEVVPGARPLSHEDLSILALENETVAGHTCKVIRLDGPLALDALRASIAARLPRAPGLSMRLGEIDGAPWWVPEPQLDVAAQVVEVPSAAAVDEAAFRAQVAAIFAQHLDRSRPLWRIDVVPRLTGGDSALIWRIHHALADGMTAMHMAGAVLWDEEPAGQPRRAGPAPGGGCGGRRSRPRTTGWPRCSPRPGRCRSPGCGRRSTGTSTHGGRWPSPRPGWTSCTAWRPPRTGPPSTTRC